MRRAIGAVLMVLAALVAVGAILLFIVVFSVAVKAQIFSVPPTYTKDPFTGVMVPDAATKKEALLLAYRANDNSMSGYGWLIDLSGDKPVVLPPIVKPVKIELITTQTPTVSATPNKKRKGRGRRRGQR